MERTSEEIEKRIKGIVASAEFEGLHSEDKDVKMLCKLARGEITEEEYDKYYGLK